MATGNTSKKEKQMLGCGKTGSVRENDQKFCGAFTKPAGCRTLLTADADCYFVDFISKACSFQPLSMILEKTKNKYYYLYENTEEESWELHVQEI